MQELKEEFKKKCLKNLKLEKELDSLQIKKFQLKSKLDKKRFDESLEKKLKSKKSVFIAKIKRKQKRAKRENARFGRIF